MSTPVLTPSIDVVFVLSMHTYEKCVITWVIMRIHQFIGQTH